MEQLPKQVILYASKSKYQKDLKKLLDRLGIKYFELSFIAELVDRTILDSISCALAIINEEDKKGIDFLRSIMQYFSWTQRMMLSDTNRLEIYAQAINSAHINYLLKLPPDQKEIIKFLTKAHRRFNELIRPLHKIDMLTNVTNELLSDFERYRKEAITDPLTQLFNRRYMDTTMENLWYENSKRSKLFSLALLDMDHFKKVNDTYGHDVGDKVLKELGSLIQNNLRRGQDYAFRYGGEEFALISTDIDRTQMKLFLERLLQLTRQLKIHADGHKIKVTFSAGISDVSIAATQHMLINQADQALYQAKRAGRNRIFVYQLDNHS